MLSPGPGNVLIFKRIPNDSSNLATAQTEREVNSSLGLTPEPEFWGWMQEDRAGLITDLIVEGSRGRLQGPLRHLRSAPCLRRMRVFSFGLAAVHVLEKVSRLL